MRTIEPPHRCEITAESGELPSYAGGKRKATKLAAPGAGSDSALWLSELMFPSESGVSAFPSPTMNSADGRRVDIAERSVRFQNKRKKNRESSQRRRRDSIGFLNPAVSTDLSQIQRMIRFRKGIFRRWMLCTTVHSDDLILVSEKKNFLLHRFFFSRFVLNGVCSTRLLPVRSVCVPAISVRTEELAQHSFFVVP